MIIFLMEVGVLIWAIASIAYCYSAMRRAVTVASPHLDESSLQALGLATIESAKLATPWNKVLLWAAAEIHRKGLIR